MRIPALILTVTTAAVLIAPASPQDRVKLSRQERIEKTAKKIKELRKERIATLKQMEDVTTKLFQKGSVSFDEVYEAKLLLLQAELDAAEKESDRIPLYKNFVDESKKFEKRAEESMKTGRGTMVPALKIKARRLEAEINLERAEANSG